LTAGADWRPGASIQALRQRAEWRAQLRQFFDQRGVIEVDTPLLAATGVTDPAIECLQESVSGYWLQSSPEYAMKRLIAAGLGDCYQMTRRFGRVSRGAGTTPSSRCSNGIAWAIVPTIS